MKAYTITLAHGYIQRWLKFYAEHETFPSAEKTPLLVDPIVAEWPRLGGNERSCGTDMHSSAPT